jgi:hypothetical protein
MQDGDIIMGENGQNAPAVFEVAKQLAKQDLEAGASETISAIIERVTTEVINDRKKVAKKFLHQAKLVKAGKMVKEPQPKRKGADEGEGQGLGGAPAGNNHAADAVVAEDVEEHVGDADGKAKRKRGSASVDEVVREPRVAPTSSTQPLLPSKDVLLEPHVITGKFSFPVTTIDLTFLYLVSREELRWTNDWLHTTEPDLHAGTNPLYKPPGAVRLGGTLLRRSSERTLDNSRRRQRTPSPVDRRARPDDAKLLGFIAGALELIKERVLHQ